MIFSIVLVGVFQVHPISPGLGSSTIPCLFVSLVFCSVFGRSFPIVSPRLDQLLLKKPSMLLLVMLGRLSWCCLDWWFCYALGLTKKPRWGAPFVSPAARRTPSKRVAMAEAGEKSSCLVVLFLIGLTKAIWKKHEMSLLPGFVLMDGDGVLILKGLQCNDVEIFCLLSVSSANPSLSLPWSKLLFVASIL